MCGKEYTSEFDRDIFREEMNLIRGRMNSEGFRFFEVENENKYETVDRDGRGLTILVYKKVMSQDVTYELDGWYIFAIQNGGIVGYTSAHIDGYLEEQFVEAKTSYSVVSKKGKGIGGAMERINEHMMQKFANKYGDLVRVEMDANKSTIEKILRSEVSKELVEEMIVSRQIWLELFGPHGTRGFDRENDYEVTKIYRQSDYLPETGMKKSKNNVSIGSVASLITRWLEDN